MSTIRRKPVNRQVVAGVSQAQPDTSGVIESSSVIQQLQTSISHSQIIGAETSVLSHDAMKHLEQPALDKSFDNLKINTALPDTNDARVNQFLIDENDYAYSPEPESVEHNIPEAAFTEQTFQEAGDFDS